MSPNRRTIIAWSLGTATVLLIPIIVLLGVSLSTQGNTEDIKATQAQAQEATAAAVRNGAVSACSSTYAATYDGWLAIFTQRAADPGLRQQAADNAVEMDRRRIGVAALSREDPDEPFTCPPIPPRLVIEPADPLMLGPPPAS
jgi:hypothetical protein